MRSLHPFNLAIRHAQSEVQGLSIEEKCTIYREKGDANIELSDAGKKCAYEFGLNLFPHEEMDYLLLFYGNDARCTMTASRIYDGAYHTGLMEVARPKMLLELTKQSFGDLDGYLTDEEHIKYAPRAHLDFQAAVARDGIIDARPMNGESYRDLAKRLETGRQNILREWQNAQEIFGERVAVISITNGTNVLILRTLARGEPLENIIPYIDKVKNLKGYDLTY